MIFTNMTLKTMNFTQSSPSNYVNFTIGLIIESEKIDNIIEVIF